MTGSLEPWQLPEIRALSSVFGPYAPKENKNDSEFKKYFSDMGYTIDWDFSSRTRVAWWELIEEGELVAQIDKNVPLKDILEDLCQFHLGKEGSSKSDYTISGNYDDPRMKNLFKRVYENCNNRPSN